jgi:hypothetical protein
MFLWRRAYSFFERSETSFAARKRIKTENQLRSPDIDKIVSVL